MCLLIVKKEHGKIEESALREAFSSNSDGGGFFVANEGMKKGFFNADEMVDHYNEQKHNPMIIHFRLSTSGKTNATNCHPFKTGSYWMGHNGILSDYETSKKLCDTAMLAKDLDSILTESPKLLHSQGFVSILKTLIGTDKLAFMNAEGDFKIINEKKGHWNNDVWFSNYSYQPSTQKYTYTYWNASNKGYMTFDDDYADECDICGYEIDCAYPEAKLCAICDDRYGEDYYANKKENTKDISLNDYLGSTKPESTSSNGRYKGEIKTGY